MFRNRLTCKSLHITNFYFFLSLRPLELGINMSSIILSRTKASWPNSLPLLWTYVLIEVYATIS